MQSVSESQDLHNPTTLCQSSLTALAQGHTPVLTTEAETASPPSSPDTWTAGRSFLLSASPSPESSPSSIKTRRSAVPRKQQNSAPVLLPRFSSSSPEMDDKLVAAPIRTTHENGQPEVLPNASRVSISGNNQTEQSGVSSEAQWISQPSTRRPFVGYGELKDLSFGDDTEKKQGAGRRFKQEDMKPPVDNGQRVGRDRNPAMSGPGTAYERMEAQGVARQIKERNTNIPLPQSSSTLPLLDSSRREPHLPAPASYQPSDGEIWPPQARQGRTEAGNQNRRFTGSENLPAANVSHISTTRNKIRNTTAPHQRLLQPITSRLPKSHTLGSLISNRQAPESCKANAPWTDEGPQGNRKPDNGEREREEPSEDKIVLDKRQNAAWRSERNGNFAESRDAGSTGESSEDVTMASNSHQRTKAFQSSLPSYITSKARADLPSQVTSAQPPEYWLGRLTTLVNAFQHEEGFDEPDPAIQYDRTSAARQSARLLLTRNPEERRTKRALLTLEAVCKTPDAKASLDEFREFYSRCFGNHWPTRSDDINTDSHARFKNADDPAAVDSVPGELGRKSKNKRGNAGRWKPAELSVMDLFRSVRRSLG